MRSSGPDDLRAIGDPLAAELLPGWRITWSWCSPEDIGGALAMIYPDSKRQMATIKVAPHPEGEDVAETIAHELAHGVVSPLVELIPPSAAEVQLEEPIAERLGVLIARLWRAAGGLARASLRRGVATYEPVGGVRFRARISASAGPRARGEQMDIDPKTVQEALESLGAEGADSPAGAVLKKLLAALITGNPTEPDGDEPPVDPMAKDPNKPEAPAADAAPPAPGGDMRARLATIDADAARLRKARQEAEAITANLRKGAKEQLIDALRARLPADHKGLPAVEKRILAAGDYGAAKLIFDLAIEMAPEAPVAAPRARGDRQTASPSPAASPQIVKPADFDKFDPSFQSWWLGVAQHEGQEAADALLAPARARLARDTAQGRN